MQVITCLKTYIVLLIGIFLMSSEALAQRSNTSFASQLVNTMNLQLVQNELDQTSTSANQSTNQTSSLNNTLTETNLPVYKRTWFLLTLLALILGISITMYLTRSNFSFKNVATYSSGDIFLKKVRFLTLCYVLAFPLIEYTLGETLHLFEVNWQYPLLALSLGVLFFAFSYVTVINLKWIHGISLLNSILLTAALIYRCHINDYNPIISIQVIVFMAFATMVFNDFLQFSIYGMLTSCYLMFEYLNISYNEMNHYTFLLGTGFMILFTFLFHVFQTNKVSKFVFAERILNTYDKLVLVYNKSGEVVYVNPYLKKIVGKTDQEVMGDQWYKVRNCDAERTAEIKGNIGLQIASKNPLGIIKERIYSVQDQKTLSIEWSFQLLEDDFLMAIGADVTALEEQRKEIDELSFVTQSVTNGIAITEPNGMIRWVNASYQEITGYKFDELIGQIPLTFFDIPAFFKPQYDDLFKDGPIFFRPITICQTHPKGYDLWLLLHLTPLYDENEKLNRIITVVTDITEEKKKDIEFAKLSLIAQHTQNPILFTSNKYQINWVNQSVTDQFGYTINDISGKVPGPLFFKGSLETEEYKQFVSDIENGIATMGDFLVHRKDGSGVWMNVSVDPIKNENGEIESFICLMQNIEELKKAQATIEEKNKDIIDSISYALKIQKALLPNLKLMKQSLPEHFLFYKPKDIISGDFYFAEMKKDRLFMAIADCTGHGVPGALMTSIGSASLNNAINDKQLTDPAQILNHIDNYFKISLSTSRDELTDGMDIGLICLNFKNKTIEYCGAKRPLIVFDKDKNLSEVKGIKRSIGEYVITKDFDFITTTLPYEDGMTIFCFSDGVSDQFGGTNGKKMYQRNLIDRLQEKLDLPMDKQHLELEHLIIDWMGDQHSQTDDMVLFGARLTDKYMNKINQLSEK